MTDSITTARKQTARVLATRELSCWEGEYSPEPEEYDDAHRRTTRAILEPSGPLAPLCAAYEAQLAEVTRERDALARWKRWTTRLEGLDRMEHSLCEYEVYERCVRDACTMRAYGTMLRLIRGQSEAAEFPTMGAAAALLGCTVADYSAVERGRNPPFDEATTRRLCAWLGCDPQPLLDAAKTAEEVLRG